MSTYAVIDKNGLIINLVVWDGIEEWFPPEGTTTVDCEENICEIGGEYKNGVFLPPPTTNPSQEQVILQADNMKLSLMSEVNSFTQIWQTQLMLGIINESDKASLTEWMRYYQKLQSIDTSSAPIINWPEKPTS